MCVDDDEIQQPLELTLANLTHKPKKQKTLLREEIYRYICTTFVYKEKRFTDIYVPVIIIKINMPNGYKITDLRKKN